MILSADEGGNQWVEWVDFFGNIYAGGRTYFFDRS